jgi:uncharacterized protein
MVEPVAEVRGRPAWLRRLRLISMFSIPKRVQDFIAGKMAWVATATWDGEPNTTPKGTAHILDDHHLVFVDLYSMKTRRNLEQNPKVAVTFVDLASAKGYQLKGTAELLTSGPIYDQMARQLEGISSLPLLRYVVKVTVEAIYDQSVGSNAGVRIA